MLAIIWVAIMLVSVIATYLLIRGELPNTVGPMIGIGLGFLLTYGAFGIEFATGSNDLRTSVEPELAMIGLAIVVVHAIYLVTDLVDAVDISVFTGSR
jgi:hypothetical protein